MAGKTFHIGKLMLRFDDRGVNFRLGDGKDRRIGLSRSAQPDAAQPYADNCGTASGSRFDGDYSDANGYDGGYDDRDPGYDGDYDDHDPGYDGDYNDRGDGYDDGRDPGYDGDYDDRGDGYGYDNDGDYDNRGDGYGYDNDGDYGDRDPGYDDGYGDYDGGEHGYDGGYADDGHDYDGNYGDYEDDDRMPIDGAPAEGFGAVLQYVDENDWVTYLLLFLLPPLGIYLLWRRQRFEKTIRYFVSAASAVWFIILIVLLATVIFGGRQDEQAQAGLTLGTASPTPSISASARPETTPAPNASASTSPNASAGTGATPNPGASVQPGASPSATPITGTGTGGTNARDTVWITNGGEYYHSRQDCSNIGDATASQITLALAQSRGLYACPLCYDETTYYATETGRWYHTDQHCSGMSGAIVYSLERAQQEGKEACPVCVLRTQTSLYPGATNLVFASSDTTDRSNMTVYWNTDGRYYHMRDCSSVSGASPGRLLDALLQGKTACPDCCPIGDTLVWCTEGGEDCHLVQNCRGMSGARQLTLAEAMVLGKGMCSTCMSQYLPEATLEPQEESELYVYAVRGDRYYHIDSDCSNMGEGTPTRGTLRAAVEMGMTACPVCSSAGNQLVYYARGGTYYHSYATCSGMENAQAGTLGDALAYGYQMCPNCWGSGTTAAPTTAPGATPAPNVTATPSTSLGGDGIADETLVYATPTGRWYHLNSTCGGMTNAYHISLRLAIEAGKTACPTCCTVASTRVYSAQSDTRFHRSADCSNAVSGATARSLADAMMLDQSPCSVCWSSQSSPTTPPSVNLPEQVYSFEVGTSGIQVYSLLTDAYYHTNSTCSGRTGLVQVALETALNYGKTACPVCASGASTTVYSSRNNSYYHLSRSCAGDGAIAGTYAYALALGMEGCPYCVTGSAEGGGEVPVYPEPGNLVPGTSGIYVYASADGDHYHLSADDAGSGAIRVALETALNYGKSACPDCCPIGDATVYATPGGRYFHANQSHADDDSVGLTCALALSLGLEPCPTCFSSGSGETGGGTIPVIPTAGPEYAAPESTVVYVDLYSSNYLYHSASSCSGSGMSGGTAETLEFALDLGYGRCPYCNPPSSIG